MVATVKFFIFAHGNVICSEESVSYDRDALTKIKVQTDASYEDLVNTICARINIDQTTHQITVHHRHPKCVEGRVYYLLRSIRDDTDVEDLVEMAEKKGEEFIQELYIEIFERSSIALSEHEMLQKDIIMPLSPKAYPLKRDRTVQNDDFMPKRARYDIHLSKDISNNHREMNSVPEGPPTEMYENLVVPGLRYENPSQNVMIHKLDDPMASSISPSQMSMNITNGMEEGNQTLRASSSTTLPAQYYEVFLSFRGIDTRSGFTDHLYNGLVNVGVSVFRDDNELRVGKEIGFELRKAIEASRISIPIISKNYASSSWCLRELVQILKCMKTLSQVMLPIFYQVKPSEVRNQTGYFGNGFLLCKDKHHDEKSLIQEWTNALKEVASLKGWESSKIANGHEAELVRVIVRNVLQVLGKVTLPICDHLVGVEDRVQTIIKRITKAKESNDVQAIVIHGMGGIGKTTLAKFLYNRLCNHFEHCSFLANIRATSQQHKGIEDLQKQLVLNILGEELNITSIAHGETIIQYRCCRKKVLILLDDIDHKDQLDALAGKPNWFGRGTIIIVTSRRKDLLKYWEDSFTYELNGLNADQSFILFCMHAFKRSDSIPDEYNSIAKEIVFTTGGLPLAIEVIGSLLRGEKKCYWEGNLKILKETPHRDVQKILKISFDALEHEEKEIFLDIACLNFGFDYLEARDYAFFMWDACGLCPRVRIKNLISLSLIKIGDEREFIIHDQLRDLGREVVRQESINDPGQRSRIWKKEDGLEVLELNKGTQQIQALHLEGRTSKDRYTSKQFERMINLRYLSMFQVNLEGDFEDLFQNLKWLRWSSGRLDFMGSNFIPKRLVVLELWDVNIVEQWMDWSEMKNLRALDLSCCSELITLPNISALKELEVLRLYHCHNLRNIHPTDLRMLSKLKKLFLCCCYKLDQLPNLPNSLTYLVFLGKSFKTLPDFSNLTNLEYLEFDHHFQRWNTTLNFTNLDRPTILQLGRLRVCFDCLETEQEEYYEDDFQENPQSESENIDLLLELPSTLVKLILNECYTLRTLSNFSDLKNLTTLSIDNCPKLMKIDDLDRAKSLTSVTISRCDKLSKLGGMAISVTNLELRDLDSLVSLPNLSTAKKLKDLNIYGCKNLVEIQGLDNAEDIESVVIDDCSSLERISDLSNLKRLKTLKVHYCEKLLNIRVLGISLMALKLEHQDSLVSLPYLSIVKKLKSLTVRTWRNLVEIQGFDNVEGIESVVIKGCSLLERISDLSNLKMLKTLEVHYCEKLLEIRGLGSSLKDLHIYRCRNLVEIQGIDNAWGIESVVINGCSSLERIGNLSNLKMLARLELCNCEKLSDIQGLGKLTSLTSLSIYGCHPQIRYLDLSIRNVESLRIKDERDEFPNHQNARVIFEPLEEQGGGYLLDMSRFKNSNHIVEECCEISLRCLEPLRLVIRIVLEPLEEQGVYLPDLSRFKNLDDIVEESYEIFLGCPAIGRLADHENVHFVAEPHEEHGGGYLPDLSRFKNLNDIVEESCEIFLGCPTIRPLANHENVYFDAEPLEEHEGGYLPNLSEFNYLNNIILKGCEIFFVDP